MLKMFSFTYSLNLLLKLGTTLFNNPPSGGPKLTEWRYLYKGSRYITVGLLALGLGSLT